MNRNGLIKIVIIFLLPIFFIENGQGAYTESCSSYYKKVFKRENKDINIDIFIGYSESPSMPGTTLDIKMHHLLAKLLLKPCYRGVFFCGFNTEDRGLDNYSYLYRDGRQVEFRKRVQLLELGLNKNVIIRLLSSSVTQNEETNIKSIHDQLLTSRRVQEIFYDSLSGGVDFLFYIGHSRHGLGLSFAPWWTHIYNPNIFHKLLAVEGKTLQLPKVLGLFSCDSQKYYGRDLNKLYHSQESQGVYVLTNQYMSFKDNINLLQNTLNSMFAMKCENEFSEDLLNAMGSFKTSNQYTGSFRDLSPKIYGLFSDSPQFEKNKEVGLDNINADEVITIPIKSVNNFDASILDWILERDL